MTLEQMANLLGLDCNEVETIVVGTGIGADLLDKPSYADYYREMAERTGYHAIEPKLNYGEKLTEMESFGEQAIRNKCMSLMLDAKKDYKRMTELVMNVNWLSWYHAEVTKDRNLSNVYANLYYDCDDIAFSQLKGEELNYYINTMD